MPKPSYRLTSHGYEKLWKKLSGLRISTIAEESGIDRGIVSKILKREGGVNRKSLDTLFSSFRLDLEEADYEIFIRQPLSSQAVRPRILISPSSQGCCFAEQLSQVLEEAGNSASIAENWLHQSDETLKQYDCFLLLESGSSTPEAIYAKTERIRQLHQSVAHHPVVVMIHVDSVLSLPLNHPLHRNLQPIPQYQWLSDQAGSTETLVQFVQELLQLKPALLPPSDQLQGIAQWIKFLQDTSQLNNPDNWLLTYVGENPLKKLGELYGHLDDPDNRRVPSGYSYWGLAPAHTWNYACNDPTSHMSKNIRKFTQYAQPLFQLIDKQQFNYVSLGVGEGSKDGNIISDFFGQEGSQPRKDFLYIPVDLSLEMLGLAVEEIRHLPPTSRIAIQRDIETQASMAEIAAIAKTFGQQRPILYGFLGNTIANVEHPETVLANIAAVMREDDLFLLEARIIDPAVLEAQCLSKTIDFVKREYSNAAFRKFAESALLQYTDLSMSPDERRLSYAVEVALKHESTEQFIQIHCFFENKKSVPLTINLLTGEPLTLQPQERIRLYRSHKFTPNYLQRFVEANGFTILDACTHLDEQKTGFMVLLLTRGDS